MIHYLDKSLEALLRNELPQFFAAETTATSVAISFATPDGEFPPSSVPLPAIDMFLYDIRENRELRSNEYQVERQRGMAAKIRRSAVRVDCSYLATAWGKDNSTPSAVDEHRLLGEVMKVLLRHPTIPKAVLQGELQDQEPPLPAITLQPGRLQSLGEFWQALGGKPKAAYHYTVTIGVDVHKPAEVKLVTDRTLKFRTEKEIGP